MKTVLFLFIITIGIFAKDNYFPPLGIGPTYGYEFDTENNIWGFDISLTLFGFSDKMPIILSTSLNPRIFVNKNSDSQYDYSCDLQITLYLIWFNIGGGIGYNSKYKFEPHIFSGIPIGLPFSNDYFFKIIYIEPYYRLNFYNGMRYHEFGLMLKISSLQLLR